MVTPSQMVKSQSKIIVLVARAAQLADITPTLGAKAVESVSITYEEGTPVASKVIQASPLSGQAGWTTVGGADALLSICVVIGLGYESRRAACFGSAYWVRQLQRSLDLQESDGALRITDLPTGRTHPMSWNAKQGFPDQDQLDHMVEGDATVHAWDQGYSGWAQMDGDEIYVVNYTDDTAPANGLETRLGVSWIRGTHLKLSDLPGTQPEGGDVR